MQILTLIPEADTYGIIIFVLFSFASFSFSNFLFSRYFAKSRVGLLQVNLLVKLPIVAMGFLLIPAWYLFTAPLFAQILALPTGLSIGVLSVYFEKWAMRGHFRKNSKNLGPQKFRSDSGEYKIQTRNLFASDQEPIRRSIGLKKITAYQNMGVNLFSLIALAILEEIIFRGFLLTIFIEFVHPYPLQIIGVLMTIVIFGLSHLLNGNAQMKSKIFFASLTTLSFCLLKTVIAPIIAHIYLNSIAYSLSKKEPATANS